MWHVESVLQVSNARFPTDDKRGLEMVNSAMEENRKVFKEHMANLRHQIEHYTDDELLSQIDAATQKGDDIMKQIDAA